ncbi:MAG: hypothetical protein AB1743_01640 [Actinomycetota bacterium]
MAGLETEAKESRTTEAFCTNQILSLPEDPSESKRSIVFFAAHTLCGCSLI